MSEEYLEIVNSEGYIINMEKRSVIKWTARFFFISSKRFMFVFLLSYIAIALLGNYVHFVNYTDVEYSGTIELVKMEPVYHFLLRCSGVIDGGEFKKFDTDLSRLWNIQFLYAFASLYVFEWIIYRIFSLVHMLRERTS